MSNRSQIGQGKQVKIFVAGPAEEFSDSMIGNFHGTAICSSQGEDFASTMWPVVVKVQAGVTQRQLVQHLTDLLTSIMSKSGPPLNESASNVVPTRTGGKVPSPQNPRPWRAQGRSVGLGSMPQARCSPSPRPIATPSRA